MSELHTVKLFNGSEYTFSFQQPICGLSFINATIKTSGNRPWQDKIIEQMFYCEDEHIMLLAIKDIVDDSIQRRD
jgi:hypothetical protein